MTKAKSETQKLKTFERYSQVTNAETITLCLKYQIQSMGYIF